MTHRAALAILIAAVLWTPVAARSQTAEAAPRIVAVRYGSHAGFDRLVIEVSGELETFHQPIRAAEAFVLELNARPVEPVAVLETHLARMGRVHIEGIADGAMVRVQARPRRIRAFVIDRPTRIVIDFADPEGEPLELPGGARRVLEAVAPPAPPMADSGPKALQESAEVAPPLPTPRPPAPVGESRVPAPPPQGLPGGLAMFLGVVGAALLGGGAVWLLAVRKMRSAPPLAAAAAGRPDTITPEELSVSSEERIAALETRLDREVRTRNRIEGDVAGLREDLKVTRDRLRRLRRRGGDDS